jgi:uncharacterized membrane protein
LFTFTQGDLRAAPIFLNPAPYLAFDNTLPGAGSATSPFAGTQFSYFHLETFEDNLLNTAGVTDIGGNVIRPGPTTDSVDADDGSIDGSGVGGHSMFGVAMSGIRFNFSAAQLGQLPTHVGIVWTDGPTISNVSLEAFDAMGASLGTRTEFNLGDGNFRGGTGEDRFFRVIDMNGISAIRIRSPGAPGASGTGIEVDHLQFGLQTVPEPNALMLVALALAALTISFKRSMKQCGLNALPLRDAFTRDPRGAKTMRHPKLLVIAATVLWSTVWCGAAHAAEPFFTGLGDLPGGSFSSSASGVSANGSVVVGIGNSASGTEAFRWTIDAGMVGLGGGSSASDVSADGSVVVGQWGSQAFRWTQNTGLVGLGDFPGGLFYSIANAVSADGSVIVGRGAREVCTRIGCRNSFPAFRWTQTSGLMVIGIGAAMDISSDGTVVVGGSSQAARWTEEGGGVSLGDLPGGALNSFAWGVSADGSVIVGQGNSSAGPEAFRWTESSGMIGLGIPTGFDFSRAHDVSADGSVVVGSLGIGVNTDGSPFIWDAAHGIRKLQDVLTNEFGLAASLSGWTLNYASAVSADGQFIVGGGINPIGDPEAWIARLAPVAPLPGDFNHDGTVDAADYVVWRKTGGSQGDYTTWRTNFGRSFFNGSGASARGTDHTISPVAPEPATELLVFGAVVMCLSIRQFREELQ